jgi:hypothetical protein
MKCAERCPMLRAELFRRDFILLYHNVEANDIREHNSSQSTFFFWSHFTCASCGYKPDAMLTWAIEYGSEILYNGLLLTTVDQLAESSLYLSERTNQMVINRN